METVKISPKFQLVIPKKIREQLKLRAGQELLIYALDGGICMEIQPPITVLRGIAKGLSWKTDYRDRSDRF